MNKKLVLQGLISAVCEVVYVALVVTFINFLSKMFGQKSDSGFIEPIIFLTLLVTSVAVSAGLIFGRSVMLYLDGKKKESVKVFGFTIGWLIIILAILFFILGMLK